jgi:hypothetical protein
MIHWKQLLIQLIFWGLSECLLDVAGLDHIAAYGEFLQHSQSIEHSLS